MINRHWRLIQWGSTYYQNQGLAVCWMLPFWCLQATLRSPRCWLWERRIRALCPRVLSWPEPSSVAPAGIWASRGSRWWWWRAEAPCWLWLGFYRRCSGGCCSVGRRKRENKYVTGTWVFIFHFTIRFVMICVLSQVNNWYFSLLMTV